ncbi:MAG TPA: hypothetical protein VGS41_14175 [Chthonomonadales bacterium]|nr:hypothetical protein [Chthonomonadales bacterium]
MNPRTPFLPLPQFIRTRWTTTAILWVLLIADAHFAVAAAARQAKHPTAAGPPILSIEYFGAEQGYAVGVDPFVLLCVVRNSGPTLLRGNSVQVRCDALDGLDYTTGSLRPFLPALAPGQADEVRFRLQPGEQSGPLIAAIELKPASATDPPDPGAQQANSSAGPAQGQVPVGAPSAYLCIIPHLADQPELNVDPAAGVAPSGGDSDGSLWIGNDTVFLRVYVAGEDPQLMLIGARAPEGWHTVALCQPLASISSCEPGQRPWRLPFRIEKRLITNRAGAATVQLDGGFGDYWRGSLSFTVGKSSGLISGDLRLTARKEMTLARVELPRLLGAAPAGDAPPGSAGPAGAIAYAANGLTTYGVSWPTQPPAPGWISTKAPDPAFRPVLGVKWSSGGSGSAIQEGGHLDIPFRLFAFTSPNSAANVGKALFP